MIESLTFITGNLAKAKQLSEHLHFPLKHQKLSVPEIQSLDLKEIIRYKAEEAFKHVGSPILVDDVSVTCSAMHGLPGPFIKWFIEVMTPEDFCRLLDGSNDRSAVAVATFGLYDGKELHIFEGKLRGKIATRPSSVQSLYGFGWDNMFTPEGYTKTRADLTKEEYDLTSPRLRAIKKLEQFLETAGTAV